MMGRYIFDCGHPPPRTELHPVEAAAFTHFEPLILSSAGPQPILAAKTSIYIHGEAAGRASAIYDAPIGGDSYEFNVPLPPRPSPSSKLVTSIMDIRYGGMQGVTPIITGPFNGPGYESLSMRREHVHVKIDLTSIPPSAKNYFGAHIAAGWANPAQSNVYHE